MAVDPSSRTENNGGVRRLRALAQAGRCGEATAIGVGRLYEVGWNYGKNKRTTNDKDGTRWQVTRLWSSGPGEL